MIIEAKLNPDNNIITISLETKKKKIAIRPVFIYSFTTFLLGMSPSGFFTPIPIRVLYYWETADTKSWSDT